MLPLANGIMIMRHAIRLDLERFVNRLLSRSILTDDEQEAILGLPAHLAEIKANRDFVGLRETVDHASLVVEGMIGRFDENRNGLRQITAMHLPGDMANLHSVVQPQGTSALQALSLTTILRVPHEAIRVATAQFPALAEALWRDCMVDSAILSQWVINVGRRDAQSRIAHLLCEVATRLRAPTASGTFAFRFGATQLQVADAAGLTSVHVNRVLRGLREKGLVDVRKAEVHVLDWAGLMTAGEFNKNYLQTEILPEERLRFLNTA